MDIYYFLSVMEGIGYKKQQELLNYCKDIQELKSADRTQFAMCNKLRSKDKELLHYYLQHLDEVEASYEKMNRNGIRFISCCDPDYPQSLLDGFQPPIGLFYKGRLPDNHKKKVAIVGSRKATSYGEFMAKQIAAFLAVQGVEVISGLARGIDGYAHKAALQVAMPTYAVVAGGVDMIYPPEHRKLYEDIIECGGVISEYPPGIAPMKGMFPQRNRIISGIADAVIIVEAREQSGSLITADLAMENGKDVFVVPGRLTDSTSLGCNQYIKQGAQIITSLPELLIELRIGTQIGAQIGTQTGIQIDDIDDTKDGNDITKEQRKEHRKEYRNEQISLEKEESMVYSCLRLTPLGLDELTIESGLGLMSVIESISSLCQKGLAEEYYRNQFVRST